MDKYRLEAAASGQKRYSSERPCKRCGGIVRLVSTGNCVECACRHSRAQYLRNKALLEAARMAGTT